MDIGYQVALVTDGRMSGASGKVPAAIHVTPEAIEGSNLAKIVNGDLILIDSDRGILQLLVPEAQLEQRSLVTKDTTTSVYGWGRELFSGLRSRFSGAEQGACSLYE